MAANSKVPVKKLDADYTGRIQIWIYNDDSGKWSLSFVTIDKRSGDVIETLSECPVNQINEDEIVKIISDSGLGISSISAIYSLSEKVLEVLQDSEKYLTQTTAETGHEVVVEGTERLETGVVETGSIETSPIETDAMKTSPIETDAMETSPIETDAMETSPIETGAIESSEPDIPDIDLASLRTPADVSLYIQTMKSAMDHAKPVLVGEFEVPYSQGTRAQIYRRGNSDDWWISFVSATKEPLTGRLPLPSFDVDVVAKVINRGIPSISLSAVYDAAEKVLRDIQKLEQRGTDDTILSQAVMHFTKVIEEHEAAKEYDEAKGLAEALLNTFAEMQNAVGVKEFALRIVKYLEMQGEEGVEEALDVIDENLEILFNIPGSANTTQEYINACSAFLDAHGLVDRSITLQIELAKWLIREDEATAAVNYVNKAVSHYETLGLIERVVEIATEFGKNLLEAGAEEGALALLDGIVKILEERKQHLALVDLLAEVVQAIKSLVEQASQEERDTIGVKPEYRAYAEKAVVYYKELKQSDESLDLLSWLFKNMMNDFSYADALTYIDQSLEICESINAIDRYVSISLEAADALINIASKDTRATAVDYITKAIQQMKRSVQIVKSSKRYHQKLIDAQDIPNAKLLVDMILEFLGEKGDVVSFKIAAKLSLEFSTSLFEAEIHDMGLDYLKLSGDYYGRAMATDEFIPIGLEHAQKFLEQENIQPAVELVNIVIQNYEFSKEYKKAITLLGDFANQLYPNHLEPAIEFMRKIVNLTMAGHGHSEAIKSVIEYRDKWKESSYAAIECTRMGLNVIIDRGSEYNEAVKLIQFLIDTILMDAEEYSNVLDWVLIGQKFTKHAEDFDTSIKFGLNYRDILLERAFDISAQLTTALLNLVYTEGQVERSADIGNDFAKQLIEKGQYELSIQYAEQAANIYYQIPDIQKAVNSLVNLIIELQKDPEGIVQSERLMDWILTIVARSYSNKEAADWGHWFMSELNRLEEILLANKYAAATIEYFLAGAQPDAALNIALSQSDEILKYGLFDKALDFLTSALNILSSTDLVKVKDTALSYTEKFLIAKDWPNTQKLADITLEKLGTEFELVTEFSSQFTDQLIEKGLDLRLVRKYTDKVRNIHESKGDAISLLAAANVCLDFAMKSRNQGDLDLAKEYFNEASSYHSRAGDNQGAAETLERLVDVLYQSGDYAGSIRYLNRAIRLYEMAGTDAARLISLYRSLFEKQIAARDYDKAEQTNEKVIQLCKRDNNLHEARGYLLDAVDKFRQSGQLRKAVNKFEILYEISEELDLFDRGLLDEFKLLIDDLKRSNDVESLELFKTIISQMTERLAKIEAEMEEDFQLEQELGISLEETPTPGKSTDSSTPPIPEIPQPPEQNENTTKRTPAGFQETPLVELVKELETAKDSKTDDKENNNLETTDDSENEPENS